MNSSGLSARPTRLTPDQIEQAEQFVSEHGAAAFELALHGGEVLKSLRSSSEWAYKSAIGAYQEGVPVVLLTRLHSGAKRAGERVEMRLLSGEAQLAVDFGQLS